MITFRVGVTDAEFLAKEMGPFIEVEDLTNMKNYHALVKTVINNEVYPAFTIRTEDLPKTSETRDNNESKPYTIRERIRDLSLQKYGRPKAEVEKEIRDRPKGIRKSEKLRTSRTESLDSFKNALSRAKKDTEVDAPPHDIA